MKLIREPNDNGYCGPAVLALLTGQSVADSTATLRAITGKKAIRGVLRRDLFRALGIFGKVPVHQYCPNSTPASRLPTLAARLRQDLRTRKATDTFLITLTGHFIVLKGRKIYDNTWPDGVFLRRYPHRRKHVKSVHLILDKMTGDSQHELFQSTDVS